MSCYLCASILNDFKTKSTAYAYSSLMDLYDVHHVKAMPTNDTDYSCYIKAVEVV